MSALISQDLKAAGVAPVICVLKQGAAAAAAAADSIDHLTNFFVSAGLTQTAAVALDAAPARADVPTSSRQDRALSVDDPLPPAMQYYPNLGVAFGNVTAEGLAALRHDDAVSTVTGAPPLSLIRPQRAASARLTRKATWGITALDVPELWKQGLTGKGVLVGHLDTGVDGKHPALRTAIAAFAEFDRLGRMVTPAPKPYDSDDHGTHTAATIAGRPVQGKSVGVAPKADLASAMVIEGGQVVARVLGGMDWAVGQGVRVLSMSLGFQGWWTDFVPVMQILRERNVLPVMAVGNEGAGTSRSPGNYSEVLSVGAVDEAGHVVDFSSSQRFKRRKDAIVPDLVAPGAGIIAARPGGGFQLMDGTSMATPHVAGLAALLFESKPDASAAVVENAIFGSCDRPPGMAPERGNRGMPNGPRAVELLGG